MSQEDLFASWSIKAGCRRKYEVDCKPFLPDGATMQSLVVTPPAGCPVVFEAVSFFQSGTVAQFFASVPDAGPLGYYRVEAKVEHSGGESDKQYFQMRVE